MASVGHDAAGGRAAKKPSLKARALALLAQRDHSAAELRRKLLRHAHAGDVDSADLAATEVDTVIDWLRANRYLSEERFIESRVHARAVRYGNLRIRQELAQHGLALTPEAAQALRDSELQRASEVWRRKFDAAPVDAAERARHARFLAQRGFSPEVVARLLRQVRQSSDGTLADVDPD
jgi:regulatory protein